MEARSYFHRKSWERFLRPHFPFVRRWVWAEELSRFSWGAGSLGVRLNFIKDVNCIAEAASVLPNFFTVSRCPLMAYLLAVRCVFVVVSVEPVPAFHER